MHSHCVHSTFRLSVPQRAIEDEEGFRTAGISAKDHLWKCWLKNESPPSILKEQVQGNLWGLSPEGRRQQAIQWRHEIYEDVRKEMALALQSIKNARNELKGLQQITDANILSKARVIGCTTNNQGCHVQVSPQWCPKILHNVG